MKSQDQKIDDENQPKSLLQQIVGQYKVCWKQLFIVDIAYKAVAAMILFPVVSLFFRLLISTSGGEVLSDIDILFFFLKPLGWICFIVCGGLLLGILALEQATLMYVLVVSSDQRKVRLIEALQYARTHLVQVMEITCRLVMWSLLILAPFLVTAGIVYLTMLSEYDINFYLKERPPEFQISIGIGVLLVLLFMVIFLKFLSGWVFALPLVLFENASPREALNLSKERVSGHTLKVIKWIAVWGATLFIFSSVINMFVVFIGHMLVPQDSNSLGMLAFLIGIMLALWSLASLLTNLLGTTSFAALLLALYKRTNCPQQPVSDQIAIEAAEFDRLGALITKPRLIAGSILGLIVATGIGASSIGTVLVEDQVEISAHRGSSKAAPENTMAAILQAIEDKSDWVEIDVQETADGEVVVFHDSDFMKLAGSRLKIWEATQADLEQLDIGSWFDPKFSDQRVPTLTQVLKTCKGKIKVNIELKYYGYDVDLEQKVADIVESEKMQNDIVLMSLKRDAVVKMKSLRPDWQVGLLMSVAAGNLSAIDADFLAVNASFADQAFIEHAHRIGKEVHVWTVNDAATMSQMISRGVDNIITDKPALARSVLKQRAEMSVPERLLLELGWVFGIEPEIVEL
ncbi:MAG: glycerophosphodiester phosphodiesterase family protein [Pirellulales bacterium]